MNIVSLVGRLTKDPECGMGKNQTAYAKFTVAVDRKWKDEQGNRQADFISCVAFGKTADFIGTYFNKGSKIGITGSIQTGSYQDQNGNTIYTTDVLVDGAEFVESKKEQ